MEIAANSAAAKVTRASPLRSPPSLVTSRVPVS